jgi:hypothetical protein
MGSSFGNIYGFFQFPNLFLHRTIVNCRHNRAGVFAVMEPVQSAQKTVSDTSFKTSYSPPLRVSLFYFCTTL